MPREKETYRPTLVHLRERADQLFPGKVLFTAGPVAELLGLNVRTIHRRKQEYGFDRHGQTTIEKLAQALCREA